MSTEMRCTCNDHDEWDSISIFFLLDLVSASDSIYTWMFVCLFVCMTHDGRDRNLPGLLMIFEDARCGMRDALRRISTNQPTNQLDESRLRRHGPMGPGWGRAIKRMNTIVLE